MRAARLISGLAELADRYDGYIVDLWGCVHDGQRPLPGAVEALDRLKGLGKRVVLLSNAPRRVAPVLARLAEIGVPSRCYDSVMTSGEETWRYLSERGDAFYQALGPRCLLIGPERDHGILDGAGVERVPSAEAADFILVTGVDDGETVADYEESLRAGVARDLPLICANPDLVVLIGETLTICAGALAARYLELGGRVRQHGKPYPSVYQTCFALMPGLDPARILGVGDALRTDMAGADAAGIDGLFLGGGIHGATLGVSIADALVPAEPLASLSREIGVWPAFATPSLRW